MNLWDQGKVWRRDVDFGVLRTGLCLNPYPYLRLPVIEKQGVHVCAIMTPEVGLLFPLSHVIFC